MIGFVNTSKTFSLAAAQGLQESAIVLYRIPTSDGFYPAGAIPSGEGTGIYTYSDTLTAYSPPMVYSSYTHQLVADETLIIEDKYLDGPVVSNEDNTAWAAAKIAVIGTIGANQTVIIRGNKFTNTSGTGIYIKGVDNIIIEGNYMDTVKKGIQIYWTNNVTIR